MRNIGILDSNKQVGGGAVGDPFFDDVTSLMHFDGADGSTVFTDVKGAIWTPSGTAQIDTAQSKFGGSSGLFNAVSYISTPFNAARDLSTGDFTIEFFALRPSIGYDVHFITARKTGAQTGWHIAGGITGNVIFSAGDNVHGWEIYVNSSNAVAANSLFHVAVTRQGSVARIFLDGIMTTAVQSYSGILDADTAICIGAVLPSPSSNPLTGWVDEFRITKGVARYTSDFTPPTEAFPDA